MPEESEGELLARALLGDREAFDGLHNLLAEDVDRFIQRLVGDVERSNEISQDAFLALYDNLHRLQSTEHLRPFLFRIVRNRCYDELRKRRRHQHIPLTDEVPSSLSLGAYLRSPPDDDVHWLLVLAEVRKAIDKLPEHHRQALILYFEEDFTYEQVADATNADIGTVRSRIHYGRKALLKQLPPGLLDGLK